jgi:ParB/RepB/Spo0J family partition protein
MNHLSNSRFAAGHRRKNPLGSGCDTRAQRVQFKVLAIDDLKPDPRNPRRHPREQIWAIARSIEAFGFNAPILINTNNQIIAGHGRYEAAKLLGIARVPVIRLDHLTEAQAQAYMRPTTS